MRELTAEEYKELVSAFPERLELAYSIKLVAELPQNNTYTICFEVAWYDDPPAYMLVQDGRYVLLSKHQATRLFCELKQLDDCVLPIPLAEKEDR